MTSRNVKSQCKAPRIYLHNGINVLSWNFGRIDNVSGGTVTLEISELSPNSSLRLYVSLLSRHICMFESFFLDLYQLGLTKGRILLNKFNYPIVLRVSYVI